MTNPPHNLSKQDLRNFSAEHLSYEIDMLYGIHALLKDKPKNPYIFNGLLESFVVHASVILDFFYKVPLNPEEAKAVHFVKDVQAWKAALPVYSKYFNTFNKKRNREVMHLSYARLKVPPYDKKWNSHKLVEDIREIVDLFLTHADGDRIDPSLYQFKSRGRKKG